MYRRELRSARTPIIVMAALVALMLLGTAADYGRSYTTAAARRSFAMLLTNIPATLRGLYGDPHPVALTSLGGMVAVKDATWLCGVVAIWSIVALSAALASDARTGRLEMVLTTPVSRRRVAWEKVAAHVTGLSAVGLACALAAWLATAAFGSLPGDHLSPADALGFGLWVMLMALASGAVAYALAPVLGRAVAATVAAVVTVGGALAHGYAAAGPWLAAAAHATWFGWTGTDQSLAGHTDWIALLPVAGASLLLLAVGVELAARRDIGATVGVAWLRWPRALLGLGGAGRRAAGERLPVALAWGLGLAVYGFILGDTTAAVAADVRTSAPSTTQILTTLFPGIDITTAGGFLQLAFVAIGLLLAGIAAVTLIAGWSSDESGGRIDLLLGPPIGRSRWLVLGALGTIAAAWILTLVAAAGVGLGSLASGSDGLTPALGTAVLGLYASAVIGIGVAVGGWFGPRIALGVSATFVGVTFLAGLLVPGLGLPQWASRLILTAHLGQTMVGRWDVTGAVACIVIAAAGVALGAVGIQRRDLNR